jgi:hypothetical protein
MAWVGDKVFMSYYTSNMTDPHDLGLDFAIHSGMLIALTWLIPYFILKKAQPSLQKSALKGLNTGLVSAFNLIDNEILSVVEILVLQHKGLVKQLEVIIDQCALTDSDQSPSEDSNSPLTRLLMN